MKAYFTIAPFLIHEDPSKPFVFEVNVSNFVVSGVFPQLGEDNLFHLVSFCSSNFFPIKITYKIHNKELLAIMDAFEEWCHLLEGVQHEITVYVDHKNL